MSVSKRLSLSSYLILVVALALNAQPPSQTMISGSEAGFLPR